MANTYTQTHVHFVCVVKYRSGLIQSVWKEELYRYISGIVQGQTHKMIAINGVSDHIHMLLGVRPAQSISDLMQLVKTNSSKWINDKGFVKGKFAWQEGYGAFSHSKSEVGRVVSYIEGQEEHHRRKTFREEYMELLREFDVSFEEKYLFHEPE